MERPNTTTGFEIRLLRANREWLPVDVRCCDMRRIPSVGGLLLLIREADEHGDHERDQRDTLFDPLTGLANRELFNEHLSRSLARGERINRALAVMFLDLTEPVEASTLAHAAGRIQGTIRANDVAARLGGDAFVVLIEDLAGEDDARTVARRIQSALETPASVGGQTVAVSSSVGIALSRPGITSATDILRDADRALRQSKISRGARPVPRIQPTPAPPPQPTTERPTEIAEEQAPPSATENTEQKPGTPENAPEATLDPPVGDGDQPVADSDVIDRFLALEAHLAQLLDKEQDPE